MSPVRWRRIEDLYQKAREHQPDERSAFLAEACGDDEELRRTVALLLSQDDLTGPLDRPATILEPGQQLGRYRVLKRIGSGGMGEVYCAHDEHLERDVAIKILSSGFIADEPVRRRFRREALALSKLNHPNIATIFDFDTQNEINFISMELIRGTLLSGRVEAGALDEGETVRLGLQLADGLAAAHAQGVIHHDLKPANLMITSDGRLKILDFGVAVLAAAEGAPDATRTMTEPAGIAGTPPYMSPEQLRGQRGDARSDVYAAGAVLYEMVTGCRAFPESQSADLIGAILHRSPVPPRTINPGISPGFQRIVMRALEKEPAQRYQSARELSSALTHAASRRRSGGPVVLGGLAAAVLLLAGLGALSNFGGIRGGARTAKAPPQRRSVAVLGFQNLSGRPETAWLSTSLSEMFTTELSAGEKLRTIPGENVARARVDLRLPDTDSLAKDTLARLRNNLGADFVVLGSYVDLGKESGGRIRVDLRLQDVRNGEMVTTSSVTGTENELFQLVSDAGAQLRQALGLGGISEQDASGVRATFLSDPEATRLYAEGLARFRLFDALSSRDLFQKAVSLEPGNALAHSALGAAWSALGYDIKSVEEAGKAFELSANLSRENRLAIEGRYREATKEWAKAIDVYRALWTFFPDNLEYGLRLAGAQSSGSQAREALTTVAELRKLAPPSVSDPRIDLAEERASREISDFHRELATASAAAAKGAAQGARLLVAQSKLAESRAHFNLGSMKESQAAAEEAMRIYAEVGDDNGRSTAMHYLAAVLSEEGKNAASIKLDEEVLETCRKLGNKLCMANALNNIGIVLKDEADFAGAQRRYELCLELRREIGDRVGESAAVNNVAVLLYEQGKLAAAKSMYEQTLAIARDLGQKRGIARALTNISMVIEDQGDLAGARRIEEESVAIRRELGDKNGLALALTHFAEVLLYQGDLAGATQTDDEQIAMHRETGNQSALASALFIKGKILTAQGRLADGRKAHEEALAIRRRLDEHLRIPDSILDLAALSIEEGHGDEAERRTREVRVEILKQKLPETGRLALAHAVLARALLAQGRIAEAGKEIGTAESLSSTAENSRMRFDAGIAAARIHVAQGNRKAAGELQSLATESAKRGFVGYQLEAQLALGEAEMKFGPAESGLADLTSVEKDAAAKGYVLIARKAHAARGGR